MKIFIIILHFGELKVTYKCLDSILKHEKEFENIVIVNNDSSRFNSKLKIINNKENIGYAGGMNVGIKYALSKGASHVLLLNNDIVFEEPVLQPLFKFLQNKKDAGIVSPAIKFNRNNQIIYDLGGKVDLVFGKTKHFETPANPGNSLGILETNYVSGCCMMIKKEVFKKIGFFDESFFMYYEDVDFCLRAKKAGFSTYCLSHIQIFHVLSKSVGKDSSKAIYYQIKSALIFGKKHIKYQFLNNIFIFYQSLIFFIKYPQKMINLVLQLINNRI